MRFALENDIFNVFGSQMPSNQRQGEKRDAKKSDRACEDKLNFAEMLSKESMRVAASSI